MFFWIWKELTSQIIHVWISAGLDFSYLVWHLKHVGLWIDLWISEDFKSSSSFSEKCIKKLARIQNTNAFVATLENPALNLLKRVLWRSRVFAMFNCLCFLFRHFGFVSGFSGALGFMTFWPFSSWKFSKLCHFFLNKKVKQYKSYNPNLFKTRFNLIEIARRADAELSLLLGQLKIEFWYCCLYNTGE